MGFLRRSIRFIFFLCVSEGIAANNSTTQACNFLSLIVPGQLSFPGSHEYEDSIASYFYLGTRLRPTCLASPESIQDVVTIIKTLSKFKSVHFAIRSGGHNTNRGFADTDDGITIDLSALSAVQLQQSKDVISVGPGARWQAVYDALDPFGLSIQGGRNGDVGVGGFLIGGGIGFFSPERGWACDSIKNVQIVLSDGSVINANATSHVDLFTAVKGGQNNFGIITRFDLETFPQGPMWGGIVLYSNSSDEELLRTLATFKASEKFDPYAMLTFGFLYDAAQRLFTASAVMYHTRPENVSGSTLESFAKIEPQIYNSIRTGPLASFPKEKLSPITKNYYMHWATTTFAISPTILSDVHDSFRRASLALTDEYASANLTIAYSYQSVPAAAPASNPNSLGFDPSSHPERDLINLGIAFQYEKASATVGLQQAIRTLMKEIDGIAEVAGVRDRHLYLNYAGSWQDVFGGYGNESLLNMKHVASKYDGREMFQQQVRGGFKLPR